VKYNIRGLDKSRVLKMLRVWYSCCVEIPKLIEGGVKSGRLSKQEEVDSTRNLLHSQAHDYAVAKSWRQ
jgi:hypothetical protein